MVSAMPPSVDFGIVVLNAAEAAKAHPKIHKRLILRCSNLISGQNLHATITQACITPIGVNIANWRKAEAREYTFSVAENDCEIGVDLSLNVKHYSFVSESSCLFEGEVQFYQSRNELSLGVIHRV